MTETASDTTTTTTPAPIEAPAAKKAAAKKAPAKKAAAAPTPAPEESTEARERRSITLPALPDGFAYTTVAVTGPDGATITVEPNGGADAKPGETTLAFQGAGLNRTHTYPDIKSAVQGIFKAAKGIDTVNKREEAARLAREQAEAFDL